MYKTTNNLDNLEREEYWLHSRKSAAELTKLNWRQREDNQVSAGDFYF